MHFFFDFLVSLWAFSKFSRHLFPDKFFTPILAPFGPPLGTLFSQFLVSEADLGVETAETLKSTTVPRFDNFLRF